MTILSTLLLGAAVLAQEDRVADLAMDFNEDGTDFDDFRDVFEDESGVPVLQGAPRDRIDDGFKPFTTCPGSNARQHCMAQMKVSFGNSCADVSAEISARANMEGGWKDPHNQGKYTLLEANDNMIKVKRRTGNNKYTDVQTFALSALGSSMCEVNACSVSQGNSNNDAGTNMCDMAMLFCGENVKNPQNGVACKPIKKSLTYTTPVLKCGRYTGGGRYLGHQCQNLEETCLRNPSTAATEALAVPAEAPLLGRAPRDFRHDGFQKLATCPGSGARQHTMAQMTVTFANSCADVSAEIQARASGASGWKDPHNRGTYTVLATEGNMIKIKRRTGNNRYTDVQTFALTENGPGCSVNACSESQGNSNNDAGTNMCDMQNLFCNSATKNDQNGVACKPVKTDLQYSVSNLECGRYRNDGRYRQHQCQNFEATCLKQESAEVEDEVELPEAAPLLGRPRDQRHPGFQKLATCPGSGAREHTMAQSTIAFANSCADVSAEIQARATGAAGWKDPHNRGKYTLLEAEGNMLKIKRRTGNNKYTDVQTFAMTANGSGCTVNACSVSQGNSNNDAGTNMCDMGNLYCNTSTKNAATGVACKPVKTDLQYTVTNLECGRYRGDGRYRQHQCQNFEATCLKQPSLEAGPVKVLKSLEA